MVSSHLEQLIIGCPKGLCGNKTDMEGNNSEVRLLFKRKAQEYSVISIRIVVFLAYFKNCFSRRFLPCHIGRLDSLWRQFRGLFICPIDPNSPKSDAGILEIFLNSEPSTSCTVRYICQFGTKYICVYNLMGYAAKICAIIEVRTARRFHTNDSNEA